MARTCVCALDAVQVRRATGSCFAVIAAAAPPLRFSAGVCASEPRSAVKDWGRGLAPTSPVVGARLSVILGVSLFGSLLGVVVGAAADRGPVQRVVGSLVAALGQRLCGAERKQDDGEQREFEELAHG